MKTKWRLSATIHANLGKKIKISWCSFTQRPATFLTRDSNTATFKTFSGNIEIEHWAKMVNVVTRLI